MVGRCCMTCLFRAQFFMISVTSHPENQEMDVRRQVQGVSGSGMWHPYLSETNIVVLISPSQALWPQRGARAYYADSAYYYTLLTEKRSFFRLGHIGKKLFCFSQNQIRHVWMDGGSATKFDLS